VGTILLSALVAHTAWHWMLERGAALREYRFTWPELDASLLLGLTRWAMLVILLVVAVWGLYTVYGRYLLPRRSRTDPAAR
jgi:hypothetical protein